jgi:hypothetical protein
MQQYKFMFFRKMIRRLLTWSTADLPPSTAYMLHNVSFAFMFIDTTVSIPSAMVV